MKMKRIISTALFITSAFLVQSQQTRFINDPEAGFKQAKEFFQREHYSLAYPLFKELHLQLRETDRSNQALNFQEINYYTIVCALKQNESTAVALAQEFIDLDDNQPRVEMMGFHLAEYYFRKKDYYLAIENFNKTQISNLSNREIADMKFHQGYAFFHLQRFNEAKPLLDAIRQVSSDPNYIDANYYYSFILFNEGRYKAALSGFKIVEASPQYKEIVPFYIATIMYNNGEKEKAMQYAESALKSGSQYYEWELRQMLGHAYFEKNEYAKALPHLEAYVKNASKLTRQDIYELSYSYYSVKNYNKAIEGFKQLGGKEDSLAQHAMYLLGDAYLQTNQKANARNAFLFCAANSSNAEQQEISTFNYAKLSHELKFPDIAQSELENFLRDYPNSSYNKEARELLVAVLSGTSNFKDALSLLESIPNPSETVLQLKPRIMYGRATELINDGMLVSASELLDKALKAPFNNEVLPYCQFWKAEISYRLNKTDDAIKYYFEYLNSGVVSGEVNPNNARYNLGYCFIRKENYKQAQTFFEQIVKIPRINSPSIEQDAYVRMADCRYMNKEFAKAVAMYDQVIQFSWPASDYATFQKAMVAGVNNGNEKIKLLQTIARVYPGSSLLPDVNMEIANAYLSDEQYSKAIPFLKNVASNTINESLKPKALLKAGIAYSNLENNKEALNQYNMLLKQYPNAPEAEDALENARAIYIEEGRTNEYVGFAKSLGKDIAPSAEDSLTYAAAEVKMSSGDFNAALTRYDDYIARFPDGKHIVDAYFYRSEIYFNRKDWVKAVAGYEAVADRVPNKFGEKSLLQSARLNFFDLKAYEKAETYYQKLIDYASTKENKLEGMRGLLRSEYQLKKWEEAAENAAMLLQQSGTSADDKVLSNMVLAKSAQQKQQLDIAISYFKTAAGLNKAAYGAEARYEIAHCLFVQQKLKEAEKAAFETINKSGSYERWVSKSYLLLGDIYFVQKDFFNAKATFQSVLDNTSLPELKAEAQQKLTATDIEAQKNSKVENQNG